MRRPRVRLTLRGSMIVVALLAALLAFVVVPISREIERRKRREEYNQVADGMTAALFALKNRVPQGVDPSRWQAAVEWTAVAHFNAFHLRHPPPIEEAYRLRRTDAEAEWTGGYADARVGVGPYRADGRRRQGPHRQTWANIPEMLHAGDVRPPRRSASGEP